MSEEPSIYIVPGRRRRRIPPLRKGVYILPNLFTTAGLLAGFYSLMLTLNHRYDLAAWMILVAQLCDVLDGRIARLTRSTSSFGIQYDSLADLVAFGVAPGILVHQWALRPWGRWGWLAAGLYVTCGALRLARFNVQIASVEKRYFVGLPIPAAAGVIASTVLLYYNYLGGEGATTKHLMMLLLVFAVAGLMVSEVRYYSFKEIRFHHRHPFPVLLGLIVLMWLAVQEPVIVLFLGSTTYALSGPVTLAWRRFSHVQPPAETAEAPAARAVGLDKPGPHR